MFRSFARLSLIVAIAFALCLATVAPASAGETRRPTVSATTHWVAAAWSWAQSFWLGSPSRPVRSTDNGTVVLTPVGPTGPGGGMHTNTGSCIDPMGRPGPCGQY